MSNVITATIVRGSNGRVDSNETMSQFHNDLAVFIEKEEENTKVISGAVDAVWDKNPSLTTMSIDELASKAMSHLEVPAGAFAEVQESIKDYVRAATDAYAIVRGKGGGVTRLDRVSADTLAKINGQREKAAAKKAA